MRPWVKSVWGFVQYCADCVVLLACWALWIALGGLLVAQSIIAFSREFAVPAFVLRSMEARFTASDVKARFGRATFDPTGGVLLETVSLSLPQFSEPAVKIRAVLVDLDPWSLLAGEIAVRRVQASGVTLSVPAMLTHSGRSEAVLSELDFSVMPTDGLLKVEHLTARIAGIALDLAGDFQPMKPRSGGTVAPVPLLANLAQNYAYFCRQVIRAADELSVFEDPRLHAQLTASPEHGAIADVTLTARALKLPRFHAIAARELRATLRVPLLGDTPGMSLLTGSAAEIEIANSFVAQSIAASVQGLLNPAHFSFVPQELQITAGNISARGFSVQSISSHAHFSSPSTWIGAVIGLAADSPLNAEGEVDVTEKTAAFRLNGAFAPSLLDPISTEVGRDVRRYVDFGKPVLLDLDLSFRSGWKFEKVTGHISATDIDAYDVGIDSASGEIEFDGRRFLARDATARLGENVARGSFEQDLSNLQFRFLLEGRLRPLDISGWFGPWWPDFFDDFKFPVEPPNASVDVTGRWFAGHETGVFVFAENVRPEIRGTRLDYGRVLMFVRPNRFDGLEFFGTHGAGELRGTFSRLIDPEQRNWSELAFALTSTLDLATGRSLLGSDLAERVPPFTFSKAPQVTAWGQLYGPAAPSGEHQTIRIEARSTGAFSLFDFPASDLWVDALLEDGDVTLETVEAQLAGGTLTGRAQVSGPQENRKLSFDATLRDALLGDAVTVVSEYTSRRRGESTRAADTHLPGPSQIKMDLSVSAEGNFVDLFSYHGTGTAQLSGTELGELRLLGLLSELLDFTALRFTKADLAFQLAGREVVFSSFNVTGPNSAIEGHGDYSLERGDMDFNARVYPFQESKSVLQNVVGAVLSPLSTVLEVKLTGPLKQPKWAFVIGPTNFFRSLTEPHKDSENTPNVNAPSPSLNQSPLRPVETR